MITRPEDFAAAANLYGALSGTAGGQETKLTKNEAAALETVARMGVEIFTVRQLQSALGLSYHKTRRILHGYTSRGTPYSGLLEKCPAVSLYDATVTEDGGSGVTVRRREQYFTFDNEVYRAWNGGASVWPDDDDSNDSSSQQNDSTCCQQEDARNEEDFENASRDTGTYLYRYTDVQQNERTESTDDETSSSDRGARVSRTAVIQTGKTPDCDENREIPSVLRPLNDSTCCQSPHAVNPADYIALPVEKDEPCHVCGRRLTSSVKRGVGDLGEVLDALLVGSGQDHRGACQPRGRGAGVRPVRPLACDEGRGVCLGRERRGGARRGVVCGLPRGP